MQYERVTTIVVGHNEDRYRRDYKTCHVEVAQMSMMEELASQLQRRRSTVISSQKKSTKQNRAHEDIYAYIYIQVCIICIKGMVPVPVPYHGMLIYVYI